MEYYTIFVPKPIGLAIVALIIGIIFTVFGIFNIIPALSFRAPRISRFLIIGIISLAVCLICLFFSIHIWRQVEIKSEIPKEESLKSIKSIRRSKTERKIESLMNELKSDFPSAAQGNLCPYCSANLNQADELKIIKYVNCSSCEISIPLGEIFQERKCPNCQNSLVEAEINKFKLIKCPKCKKSIKG